MAGEGGRIVADESTDTDPDEFAHTFRIVDCPGVDRKTDPPAPCQQSRIGLYLLGVERIDVQPACRPPGTQQGGTAGTGQQGGAQKRSQQSKAQESERIEARDDDPVGQAASANRPDEVAL